MRVGLTYDLRSDYLKEGYSLEETAEFDKEDTIAGLARAIASHGHDVDRIGNVKALVARLAKGDRWDLVFNIAEGMRGIAREAQVPALLEAYDIPCTFADAGVLTLCLHKGYTKAVLQAAGVATAPFAVVEREADIARVALPYPLFVKPVAEGTGKGITPRSIVRDAAALKPAVLDLLKKHGQPVLVEPYLTGREFTVGLFGSGTTTRAVAAMEIHLGEKAEPGLYSLSNKENYEDRVTYTIATDALGREAKRVAIAAWTALGCRDAGRADLRAGSDGKVYFLEVNPLAGINEQTSDLPIMWRMLGRKYEDLIGIILDEAMTRVKR
ncbi:MAG: D-alanine--D-alanine ligase [Alphaproteobacteria bacterium]|nr:D-alanine--D-alanine ligase [Alphaproteobacteria bacterium]